MGRGTRVGQHRVVPYRQRSWAWRSCPSSPLALVVWETRAAVPEAGGGSACCPELVVTLGFAVSMEGEQVSRNSLLGVSTRPGIPPRYCSSYGTKLQGLCSGGSHSRGWGWFQSSLGESLARGGGGAQALLLASGRMSESGAAVERQWPQEGTLSTEGARANRHQGLSPARVVLHLPC